jgi:hypothetical protein
VLSQTSLCIINPAPGFSLQEEARNTERRAFWDSDQKLRHSKVTFVSAVTPDAPNETPEAALADLSLESFGEGSEVIVVEELGEEGPGSNEIEVLVEDERVSNLVSETICLAIFD